MSIERETKPAYRTFGIRHSTLVILLTLLAGCLRFGFIDKPAIWGDEAASWRRICGSWQQMVDELRYAGFMPGHYVTTWWIKDGLPIWGHYEPGPAADYVRVYGGAPPDRRASRGPRMIWTPTVRLIPGGLKPTPLVMRFFPALCGTLMVPAIYFLASQLVARRTALLAAIFACCSAYMLGYSRDSKMYMQLWFFATLHVACLLWWLKDYTTIRQDRLAGPLAAASSPRNQDFSTSIAGVLPPRHVTQVADAFAPPAAPAPLVAQEISRRLATLLRWSCWLVTGLAMISFHAVGLAIVGIEVLIFLATVPMRLGWIANLLHRSIPRRFRRRDARLRGSPSIETPNRLRPEFVRPFWSRVYVPPIFGFAVGVFAITSLFSSYRDFTRFYDRIEPGAAEATQVDVRDMGIGWVEWYNAGRTAPGTFLENASEYLFNWEWVKPDQMAEVDPAWLSRLRWTGMVLLGAFAVGILPLRRLLDRITGSPRALERGPMPATAMLVLAGWLCIPAYGFYLASGAWNEDGARVAASLPNATIVSAVKPAVDDLPDVDKLRGVVTKQLKPVFAGTRTLDDAKAALRPLPWSSLFAVQGFAASPVRWWFVAALGGALVIAVLSWPARPLLVPAGPPLVAIADDERDPLSQRRRLKMRRRLAWSSSLVVNLTRVGIVCAVLWLLAILAFVVVPPQEQSVWMPRYLGFVWPAFAIIVCVLIRRVPLAPIRWLIILGLLTANLGNFYMRLEHGEPPTARIAADEIAAGDRRTARFFAPMLAREPQPGGPGSGLVGSTPNSYYYIIQTGLPITPAEAIWYVNQHVAIIRSNGYDSTLRTTIARDNSVRDVYVWAILPRDSEPDYLPGRLTTALGPAFSPVDPPERMMIYDHWTWRQLVLLERHHWRRTDPTTQPAARVTVRPATGPVTHR